MMTIHIKNWTKFQHFKDRSPPWIKLHRTLLDDIDFNEMPAEDARTLIKLWLIASEAQGRLPCTRKLAYRLRITEKELKQHLIRLSHWLEQDDITLISERYQDGPPEERREETEGEDTGNGANAPITHTPTTFNEPRSETQSLDLNGIAQPKERGFGEKEGHQKTSRRTRLPQDWKPGEEETSYASNRGYTAPQISHMAENFKNHHRSRGNTMASWPAAWRTWVGRESQFNRNGANGKKPPSLMDGIT